jgi:ATP-binding cassette subfamily B (MDR/TAP) protein 1
VITFDNVVFNYPSRPNVPILRGLSLTFPARHTAALVSTSGSGKLTMISLIEQFYNPLEASVKIDGIDVKVLNIRWLRSQIGLIATHQGHSTSMGRSNIL